VTLDAQQALGLLPQGLRDELLEEFAKITRNYRERRWQYVGLDGGRFCEIVLCILKGYLDGGNYPASASKGGDLKAECEQLARTPKVAGPDSVRITLPRALVALYQVRNNRDVAHVGGDVDANVMDATYVLHSVQWVMAELVRIFHNTTVESATSIITALVDRTIPIIWEVGGVRRVLKSNMTQEDKTLLLLYSSINGATDKDLAKDLKLPRVDNYRRVLRRLDDQVLIEYDESTGLATISPTGQQRVETDLIV
jgi:hypothetical protein